MTPEQVFGKLNKDIKGLTSGVASASVSGSSIIFTMNDGSTQTITFPQPKDGASIVAVSTNENNQFVFSMSDGTEIVGGEVPASSGVSKEYVDSELSKKANNSDIPTKVSGLQNDSNYQTDTDVATALTPYAKSADVTKEITNKVAEIVADAPEDFNTLKEMSDWISNHENDASAMNSAIKNNQSAITTLQTGKADKSEIPTTVAELTDSADYAKTADIPTTDDTLSSTSTNPVQNKVVTSNLIDIRKETTVNLLKPTLQTITRNGVTCTRNVDGTYTLNGTASDTTVFIVIGVDNLKKVFNQEEELRLTGSPKGSSKTGYYLQMWKNEPEFIYYDTGGGVTVKKPNSDCNVAIMILNGTVLNNVLIKPMLTTNLSATYDDFVPYTGDSGSLNWDVAELKDGKADKSKVADVNWTSVDISSVDENTNAGATINYCIKNGICYMSILNIGFKTASQAIILGDNSIPKPSSDYCLCPLVCVADPSYSVLIHPNLSGGLEHNVVGLTNQVYSGLFSYPVAES